MLNLADLYRANGMDRQARPLLEQALETLRQEYAQAGTQALFERLKEYLWGDKTLLWRPFDAGPLVYDLERPERFLSILLRPQWKSWLTRGAFLLVGFATLSGAWWAAEVAASATWDPISTRRLSSRSAATPPNGAHNSIDNPNPR